MLLTAYNLTRKDVAAALAPYNSQQLVGGILFGTTTATREQYMAIPSGARARNIICSTIGSLPLEQYNHFTNEHVRPNRVIMQPDPRVLRRIPVRQHTS